MSRCSFSVVLFDMDGLMLDTERLARRAWTRAFADHGLAIRDDVYVQVIGRTWPDTRRLFADAYGLDVAMVDEIAGRKSRYLLEAYEQGVPTKDGLAELLAQLDDWRLPRAVATSTLRGLAEHKLGLAGLLGRFDAIVCGDDVSRGKPEPDIYLLAASRLGAEPGVCVVLEDSEAGVRAGRAARMCVVMVPDQVAPSPQTAALADSVCGSLHEAADVLRAWRAADTP